MYNMRFHANMTQQVIAEDDNNQVESNVREHSQSFSQGTFERFSFNPTLNNLAVVTDQQQYSEHPSQENKENDMIATLQQNMESLKLSDERPPESKRIPLAEIINWQMPKELVQNNVSSQLSELQAYLAPSNNGAQQSFVLQNESFQQEPQQKSTVLDYSNRQHMSQELIDEEPTPVIFEEFKRCCNSEYVISEKDSESAISSDGEFLDANKINVFEEDDSHIDLIENLLEKKMLRDSIYQAPGPRFVSLNLFSHGAKTLQRPPVNQKEGAFSLDVSNEVDKSLENRPKTKRDKCMKYFTKVGYTKERMKAIPRWCTDMALMDRMVIYQQKNPELYDVDKIFGQFNPRQLELNLFDLFGAPNSRNIKKANRYKKRGSSANWNDELEFQTPPPAPGVKKYNLPTDLPQTNIISTNTFNPKQPLMGGGFKPLGKFNLGVLPSNSILEENESPFSDQEFRQREI